MICPYCGQDQSICKDSRQLGEVRHRQYKCLSCGQRYGTKEKTVVRSSRQKALEQELQETRLKVERLRRSLSEAIGSCDGILENIEESDAPDNE